MAAVAAVRTDRRQDRATLDGVGIVIETGIGIANGTAIGIGTGIGIGTIIVTGIAVTAADPVVTPVTVGGIDKRRREFSSILL